MFEVDEKFIKDQKAKNFLNKNLYGKKINNIKIENTQLELNLITDILDRIEKDKNK